MVEPENQTADEVVTYKSAHPHIGSTADVVSRPGLDRALLADISSMPKLNAVSTTEEDNTASIPTAKSPDQARGRRMSTDLLSSINKGRALKSHSPTPDERPRTADPKMSVLQDIKANKTKLKHVDEKEGNGANKSTPVSRRNAAPSLGKE